MLAKLIGSHAVLRSLQVSKVPRIATAVTIDPGGDLGRYHTAILPRGAVRTAIARHA